MQSKPSQAQIMGFPIHHPFARLATPHIMCGCGLTKNHGLNLFIVCGPVGIRTQVQTVFPLTINNYYFEHLWDSNPTPPISTMDVLTSYTKRIFFETI